MLGPVPNLSPRRLQIGGATGGCGLSSRSAARALGCRLGPNADAAVVADPVDSASQEVKARPEAEITVAGSKNLAEEKSGWGGPIMHVIYEI
ncbi:hypothetical protein CASFOL_034986 [Castilleja foliolosa]|uniref:Uncharacterized protein n=1 Tax=Castilleja foliolosa TaxID=1961234 RepID=A0ABD3BSB0_9LAMI